MGILRITVIAARSITLMVRSGRLVTKPAAVQRAFFTTTRLAKNSKPPRSIVIGWSGEMGETEFDFQTVRLSIGIFSNRSAPLSKGFPMRTAGIWRLPHQPERVLEYRVRFPPCSAIYAAALEVKRIMFGSL